MALAAGKSVNFKGIGANRKKGKYRSNIKHRVTNINYTVRFEPGLLSIF